MSAQQAYPDGVSRAQNRIALLLNDLSAAVESVEQLAATGLDEDALRMVERQRAHLYQVIDSVARDVAPPRPSQLRTVRRSMTVVAAAIAVAVSGIAVSVAVMLDGADPDPAQRARGTQRAREVASLAPAPGRSGGARAETADDSPTPAGATGPVAGDARGPTLRGPTDDSGNGGGGRDLLGDARELTDGAGRARVPTADSPKPNVEYPIPLLGALLQG